MTNIKPQKGIIGLYDILGYTDFLNNNSFDTAIKDIDNVLKTIANSDNYSTSKESTRRAGGFGFTPIRG